MPEYVEWAIHYPRESEPRPAPDEGTARNWVQWWSEQAPEPAVLMKRTVVASDWIEADA